MGIKNDLGPRPWAGLAPEWSRKPDRWTVHAGGRRRRFRTFATASAAGLCALVAAYLTLGYFVVSLPGLPAHTSHRAPVRAVAARAPAPAPTPAPVPSSGSSAHEATLLADAPALLSSLPPVAAWTQYPAEIVTPDTMTGDAPNPYILQVGSTYYMYSSQGNVLAVNANIPLRTSTDLVHWSAPTDAMPTMPTWATTGLNWAPDVHYIDGRYVMWFSAITKGIAHPPTGDTLMKCLGWATSLTPGGPFVPDPGSDPPVCQVSLDGSIDPHVFFAPGGTIWLIWKSDDNASTSDSTLTTIWSQQLGPDGTSLIGRPVALLTANLPWEARIVENGQMVYGGGAYWLFFSSNSFSSPNYSVDYARCAGPSGPCADPTVLLGSNLQGKGPGEAEVFEDLSGRDWIVYAPWSANPYAYTARPVALARLGFARSGPYLGVPGPLGG